MDHWEKLELTSDDPCRTTLINDSGHVVYSASTDDSEKSSKPVTTFTSASGHVIATLERHTVLSDKLSMDTGEAKAVGKWLKSSKWKKDRIISFEDGEGNTYRWKGFGQDDQSLQLYADDTPSEPIAVFKPSIKGNTHNDSSAESASIVLSKRAERLRDQVVLSLLLIEKGRRFGGVAKTGSYFTNALYWFSFAFITSPSNV